MATKTKQKATPEFPEHEKLQKISHLSNAQGQFLEWLMQEGYVLARWEDERLWSARTSIPALLAKFHDIDQKKIDKEKEQMLEQIRNYNHDGTPKK